MVLERIKKAFGIKGKDRDPFSTKGLEQFSPSEQERILGKIGSKEAELLKRRADVLAEQRIRELERRLGIKEPKESKSVRERLQSVKEFRQRNLKRRAERMKEFNENERLFREGKLKVKPVGNVQAAAQRRSEMKNGKKRLDVKPVQLKSPSRGLR